jgi:hypothetical protein
MITNCPYCNCPHEYDHATDDYLEAGPPQLATLVGGVSRRYVQLHTCDNCGAVLAVTVVDEDGETLYTPYTESP